MIPVLVERCLVTCHHIEDALDELQGCIFSVKGEEKEAMYILIHCLRIRRHLKLVRLVFLKNTLGIQAQWLLPNLVKSDLSATKLKF